MNALTIKFVDFVKSNTGSIAVIFSIMLPVLLGFYSLVFDGARFNFERARLTDALNQSIYAVALKDNRNLTTDAKEENLRIVQSYLTYFFPDKNIKKDLITISESLNYDEKSLLTSVDYKVNADLITHPIIRFSDNDHELGFQENVILRTNELSGLVRRTISSKSIPTDYVFVVDFSHSMTYSSAEPGLTREQLLKNVVSTLGNEILSHNDGSTFGFVPFSTGVPVRLDRTNYSSPEGKEIGCTYIAKMKTNFESFDWDFWYNKPYGTSLSLTSYINHVDIGLRLYYRDTIARANGIIGTSNRDDWLISKGFCIKEDNKLLCDADKKSNIHNPDNIDELNNNYDNFMRFTKNGINSGTILNANNVDIEGTLSGDYLFNEGNVKTYISSLAGSAYRPLGTHGCYYAVPRTSIYSYISQLNQPSYYLLELSSDQNVLDEFNAMGNPQGLTESLWGFLRAVPLIAKGTNERKIIFVISDGNDQASRATLRKTMMNDYNLCNVVRDGLKKYPTGTPTTQASIYFISLVRSNTAVNEWANSCVGESNAFTATNISELMNVIGSIMHSDGITYIHKD